MLAIILYPYDILYDIQFTMEMGGNDVGNMPKSYSLNMFQDFVPMCVLSETGQGKYPVSITNML